MAKILRELPIALTIYRPIYELMSQAQESKLPICLSIAPHHLQALDNIAEQLERSRSWVAARAFDKFLAPTTGDHESGAAVGAQDVAGLVSPRMASPGSDAAGGGAFSREIDAQMATYSTTPEAAPAVRATLGLHADTLQRAAEQSRRVAAGAKSQREAIDRRNAEYLTGKTAA